MGTVLRRSMAGAARVLICAWLLSGCRHQETTAPRQAIARIRIMYSGSTPLALIAGETYTFPVVAFDGAGSVVQNPPAATWTSSNPAVASVDGSGDLHALAGGSATLHASVTSGGMVVADSVSFVVATLSGARGSSNHR
jgi:hypothetical protein